MNSVEKDIHFKVLNELVLKFSKTFRVAISREGTAYNVIIRADLFSLDMMISKDLVNLKNLTIANNEVIEAHSLLECVLSLIEANNWGSGEVEFLDLEKDSPFTDLLVEKGYLVVSQHVTLRK